MRTIDKFSVVPVFSSREQEADFWQVNELSPKLMESTLLASDNRESTTISLRIDPRMLAKLKRLARSRYLNYQSMLKQWVAERLEAEARTQAYDETSNK